ncbi:DUF4815 domain-containing protein [Polymorphum gilvum]|uniref:Phage related protein, virulence-associated n=1 Tax=Polymorphum gilvum (strain LMG 25793 / CGMCC 1.9160 / SL003B-26A1) TaxID=991905 RepID=F2J635_POLGS|nr:DUF4815 domain-containing protein [Polymorphum gilvum]ADZ72399.1 Phage related protein, virulence-associated [Polymorphum gilvum SL003B-26A1]
MAFEHPLISGAYDRSATKPAMTDVVFREGAFLQGAELNEAQSILRGRIARAGGLSARDGDRIAGAGIVVDPDAGSVFLEPGRIFAAGDVRPVVAATLAGVPMDGEVAIGVRLVRQAVTHEQDPDLLGLAPGTAAEGEAGAARIEESLAWGRAGDGQPGDLYPVYLLKDGVALDQTAPAELSVTLQAIAGYDRDANGSYVISGCRVSALGRMAGAQVFVIEQGVANINGFKRTRSASLRLAVPETADVGRIDAEQHVFADGGTGTATLVLRFPPLANLVMALVTKETTETVTHGPSVGSMDLLSQDSVTALIEVRQGGTIYTPGTDYVLNADRVDWTPGGGEPAPGSSYEVTYRYRDAVVPVSTTDGTVTLAGGVTGGEVLLTYDYKLLRVDLICLDPDGRAVYIEGLSSRSRPVPPAAPATHLPLAEVVNSWSGAPTIINSGVRAYPFTDIDRMYKRLVDVLDLVALERLRRDIDSREPTAKRGVFVDPFTSDRWRDGGVAQDAALFDGSCQLAIDPTIHRLGPPRPVLLDWSPEVVISQGLVTHCRLVNPYANFLPIPAELTLDPAVDLWTETRTEWASAQTAVFGAGNLSRTTTRTDVVDTRQELAEFLRAIDVGFTIRGFGAGETLDALTFDGVDVTPAGVVADGNGEISGTIAIAAETYPAGRKLVRAVGGSGTEATALFVGEGQIEITVMRQVSTVTRWSDPPVREWDGSVQGSDGAGDADPLAQTFVLPAGTQGRHIAAVTLRICAVGDPTNPLLLEIRSCSQGMPTAEILSQAYVVMGGVAIGQPTVIALPEPLWLSAGREYCFVVKSDDAAHSISSAQIGAFDAVAQSWVTAQPYPVGVMLSSSNARTWTAHQDEDLSFDLRAARFAPGVKRISLGQVDLVDCTDLIIRAVVDLPEAECSVVFEVERPGGGLWRMAPGQVLELDTRVTETVVVFAVLAGTETASPTLFPGVQLIAGSLRDTATYVSRAFAVDGAVRIPVRLKALLPSGSALTVELQRGDAGWETIPLRSIDVLETDGWVERSHELDPLDPQPAWGAETRVRLTLTGGPAARPSLADLRVATI